jgi:hypothetical protein
MAVSFQTQEYDRTACEPAVPLTYYHYRKFINTQTSLDYHLIRIRDFWSLCLTSREFLPRLPCSTITATLVRIIGPHMAQLASKVRWWQSDFSDFSTALAHILNVSADLHPLSIRCTPWQNSHDTPVELRCGHSPHIYDRSFTVQNILSFLRVCACPLDIYNLKYTKYKRQYTFYIPRQAFPINSNEIYICDQQDDSYILWPSVVNAPCVNPRRTVYSMVTSVAIADAPSWHSNVYNLRHDFFLPNWHIEYDCINHFLYKNRGYIGLTMFHYEHFSPDISVVVTPLIRITLGII